MIDIEDDLNTNNLSWKLSSGMILQIVNFIFVGFAQVMVFARDNTNGFGQW